MPVERSHPFRGSLRFIASDEIVDGRHILFGSFGDFNPIFFSHVGIP